MIYLLFLSYTLVACGPIGSPCFRVALSLKPMISAFGVCGPSLNKGIYALPNTCVSAPPSVMYNGIFCLVNLKTN